MVEHAAPLDRAPDRPTAGLRALSTNASVGPARDRWEDGDLGVGGHDGCEPVEVAGVLVADEDVDVGTEPALLVAHPPPDAGPSGIEPVEHINESDAQAIDVDDNRAGTTGKLAEGGGEPDGDRGRGQLSADPGSSDRQDVGEVGEQRRPAIAVVERREQLTLARAAVQTDRVGVIGGERVA